VLRWWGGNVKISLWGSAGNARAEGLCVEKGIDGSRGDREQASAGDFSGAAVLSGEENLCA